MSPANRALSVGGVRTRRCATHRRDVGRQARHRFEQHVEALARFVPSDEEDRRAGRSASAEPSCRDRSRCRCTSRRYSPPSASCASLRASSDTAHRSVSRFATQRVSGVSHRYAALSPAAWNVPTIGLFEKSAAVTVGPGASGSCRCNTSKSSSRSARIVRSGGRGIGSERGDRSVRRGRACCCRAA